MPSSLAFDMYNYLLLLLNSELECYVTNRFSYNKEVCIKRIPCKSSKGGRCNARDLPLMPLFFLEYTTLAANSYIRLKIKKNEA